VTYRNIRDPRGPWSIHVVRVPLNQSSLQICSVHADGRATGLSPLTEQIELLAAASRVPIAAINGDFYRRDGAYAGDPRGLQILDGEMISAPTGDASFWLDAIGEPHIQDTASSVQVTWPDSSTHPVGLNGARQSGGITLYTPAVGGSTRTAGGRELILEQLGDTRWLPLRPGRIYQAKVREVRQTGNSKVQPGTMVLSIGPSLARRIPAVQPGSEVRVATDTVPSLRGVKAAISGGPIIVQDGKRQRIRSTSDSYQSSSMTERHPRSAIGYNGDSVYLVQVDGRYRNVSVGMTLNELGAFMVQLGCQQAMALDGGGSATLWFNGRVRNRPCDGYERAVANGLVVVRNPPSNGEDHATDQASTGGRRASDE
jgi:hypothetical protein